MTSIPGARKKLSSILNAYADIVEATGNPKQQTFLARAVPTKAEVLKADIGKVEKDEKTAQPSLFEGQTSGFPAARKTGREAGQARKGEREAEITVKDAESAEAAISLSPDRIIISHDAEIPESLAESLREKLAGWEATETPDGDLVFVPSTSVAREKKAVYNRIAEGVRRFYKGAEIRETENRSEMEQLAEEALRSLNADRSVSSASGKVSRPGGIRRIALGITTEFIHRGKIDFTGKTAETPEDIALLAQVCRDPRYETFRVFYLKGDTIVAVEAVTSRLPGTVKAPWATPIVSKALRSPNLFLVKYGGA